jgi:predicted DNA-binding transcriptional regulator AlpA
MSMLARALPVPEVARRLGVDGAEVYGLILDGELPAATG